MKELFSREGLVKVGEAHAPLCAKLDQEARFYAVWAGGFSISAALTDLI